MIQHAGHVMCDGGNDFAQARVRKFGKNGGGNLTPDVGKCVAVEKQERSAPVAVAQKF